MNIGHICIFREYDLTRIYTLIHVDLKTQNYLILFSTGSCLRFHSGRQRAGLPGSISGGLARCKMAGTQLRKRMAEWRVVRRGNYVRGRVSAIVEERVLHGRPPLALFSLSYFLCSTAADVQSAPRLILSLARLSQVFETLIPPQSSPDKTSLGPRS